MATRIFFIRKLFRGLGLQVNYRKVGIIQFYLLKICQFEPHFLLDDFLIEKERIVSEITNFYLDLGGPPMIQPFVITNKTTIIKHLLATRVPRPFDSTICK